MQASYSSSLGGGQLLLPLFALGHALKAAGRGGFLFHFGSPCSKKEQRLMRAKAQELLLVFWPSLDFDIKVT